MRNKTSLHKPRENMMVETIHTQQLPINSVKIIFYMRSRYKQSLQRVYAQLTRRTLNQIPRDQQTRKEPRDRSTSRDPQTCKIVSRQLQTRRESRDLHTKRITRSTHEENHEIHTRRELRDPQTR